MDSENQQLLYSKECLKVYNLHFADSINDLICFLEKKYTDLPRSNDIFRRLKFILNAIEISKTQERFLYHPLLYIKQNYEFLRQIPLVDISSKDICKVIRYLSDIIACLKLMNVCANNIIQKFIDFYDDFFNIAKKFKITVIYESFSEDTIDEKIIPQYQTIRWYKDNGYREFLRKKIIIPQEGYQYAGKSCVILKYNGNQTKVLVENDDSQLEHLLPIQTIIKWV
jgi:hypothetical protein